MRDIFQAGSTVPIYFTTHAADRTTTAPSAALTAADFVIYKDGSATEKTTTNGITVTSPFDSRAGFHQIQIDTSNNTGDAGFWAADSEYRVAIDSAKTVDSIPLSQFLPAEIGGRFRLVSYDPDTTIVEIRDRTTEASLKEFI